MKDVATPVPPAEVRGVIKKCLENAALVNYERLSEQARLEAEAKNKQGKFMNLVSHDKQSTIWLNESTILQRRLSARSWSRRLAN